MEIVAASLKNAVLSEMTKYFGENMASLYAEFYKDKTDYQILDSFREILSEHMGEAQADQILLKLNKDALIS